MSMENKMLQIAQERYTTKHYSGKQIPREQFNELLEILRLAPSSVNAQSWKFIVASSKEAKDRIMEGFLDFNRERIAKASDIIVFAVPEKVSEEHLQKVLNKEIADGRYAKESVIGGLDAGRRHFVGLHSHSVSDTLAWETAQAYIALGFILFASAGMGIDSTALEGADFDKLDEILGLRKRGLRSVVAVSLGYRAEDDSNAKRPKSRLSKEDLFEEI